MYGIVNQAIQGLVTENYGLETWEKIKEKSNVQVPFFLSDHPYDDEITYQLVASASEVLNVPASDVLRAFGEYWVLKTGYEKYGEMMKAGGQNFVEFVKNLPNFHSRIMLLYPKLSPPEFKVDVVSEHCLRLHYFSTRSGLTDFVYGLMLGLAKMFNNEISIQLLSSENEQGWHDLFEIQIH